MSERVTMPTEDWVAALDAAREKSGVTKKLLSGELAGVILGIPAGITPSGTKSITANGTYDVRNYAGAQVDVPETDPVIRPLSVTANGTYAVPANADGYGPVTVNVPTEGDGITPSGVLDITANGDYDVTQYAGVSVEVPETGLHPPEHWTLRRTGRTTSQNMLRWKWMYRQKAVVRGMQHCTRRRQHLLQAVRLSNSAVWRGSRRRSGLTRRPTVL